MRQYGLKKQIRKIHGHECSICVSDNPTKGMARMRLKRKLNKSMKNYSSAQYRFTIL